MQGRIATGASTTKTAHIAKPHPIALSAWRMTVADQAVEHQISNMPSEIHRDPVWVSRRPIGQRDIVSMQLLTEVVG